jgi:anion-transporting  ArsA/GET3 family ATPase
MASPLDKRLLFVTGKGGVGKTTVAATLGLAAAARGRRTIVCEVAEQERMSRAFHKEGVGYEETELRDHLSAISIDPEHAREEWLRFQLRSGTLASLVSGSRIFAYLAAAAPGLSELVTIGKIWELAQLERKTSKASPYDLVIVDAPATGHGLAMLRAPRTFSEIARVGPIARQAGKIHDFIADPRSTAVLTVALPEEIPVNETVEFEDRLAQTMGMKVDAIVVNALYPQRFSGADAERLESLDGGGSEEARAALRLALSEHRRAKEQRAQLRRLRQQADAETMTLPFLFKPELELDDLEALSHELEKKL